MLMKDFGNRPLFHAVCAHLVFSAVQEAAEADRTQAPVTGLHQNIATQEIPCWRRPHGDNPMPMLMMQQFFGMSTLHPLQLLLKVGEPAG